MVFLVGDDGLSFLDEDVVVVKVAAQIKENKYRSSTKAECKKDPGCNNANLSCWHHVIIEQIAFSFNLEEMIRETKLEEGFLLHACWKTPSPPSNKQLEHLKNYQMVPDLQSRSGRKKKYRSIASSCIFFLFTAYNFTWFLWVLHRIHLFRSAFLNVRAFSMGDSFKQTNISFTYHNMQYNLCSV